MDSESNDKVLEHILAMETKLTERYKEMKAQLQGLVEVNARFAQEIIAIKNGGAQSLSNGFGGTESITTEVAPKRSNKVVLEVIGEELTISGNTYAHRGIFGENGARWNKPDKNWICNSEKLENIKESLAAKEVEFEVKGV
jgi:hypothetical protein